VSRRNPIKLGLIWAQFAAYHVDRCESVARRLAGRAEVMAIEVATTSADYAWEPSGAIAGAKKQTLFPGQSFDDVPIMRRFMAMFRAARQCDIVCIGISYGLLDAILLSWALRLFGTKTIVFSESKFDDLPRSAWFEFMKALVLGSYTAAIVGGRRHMEYFRFLGFRRRPVLPGYDSVGVDRIRAQAAAGVSGEAAFADRPFLFVGRFVDKKNLVTLLYGYGSYVASAGNRPRRLILAGSGPAGEALHALTEELGIAELVDFPGFLTADAVSRALAGAAALVLVSREEQWGLVVNEALALAVPVIVSNEVGARDLLVRNLVNGYVTDSNCPHSIGEAMLRLVDEEAAWRKMSVASRERAWMGDAERIADAIEVLLFPTKVEPQQRIANLLSEMEISAR
jgi:L-malate glycosyltransferase